jgi:hypothetical protein
MNPAPSKNSIFLWYGVIINKKNKSRTFLGIRKIPKYLNREKVRDKKEGAG